MSEYFVRVNGTGNAWPVLLGTEHPFYDPEDQEQLANVSFSIFRTSGGDTRKMDWEVLVDAGHGIVQYLIRHGNRLPEAVVLTHAHLDHTLSLDWIIQSYYRRHRKTKKFPLYASRKGLDFLSGSFPQLPPLSDFHVLKPGEKTEIEGIPELHVSALPVYHGERAPGPAMLVFDLQAPGREPEKIVFSGDLLCPLLRKADYRMIRNAGHVFLDANNRFPYTASNHWSISSQDPDGKNESACLRSFRENLSCTHLISGHLQTAYDPGIHDYFDEFLAYCDESIPLSVFDFCRHITPLRATLVHYSGMEDLNHHKQGILNPVQLENWTNAEAERRAIRTEFLVPAPGDLYRIG